MKYLACTVIVLLGYIVGFAQKNYLSGYVILNNGSKISGFINYKNWEKNPISFQFKKSFNEPDITYGIKDIHSFQVEGFDKYERAVVSINMMPLIKVEDIKDALETFVPSATQTPGRLNLFKFKNFDFLVDFAHNQAGLTLLCDFVSKINGTPKVGIISGTGDRRDEDIRDLGKISAGCFDEIIIRQDKNLRGRTAEEIVNLLVEGINSTKIKEIPITIIYNEKEAIMHAYNTAKPGSLITIMCDVVVEALDMIKGLKEAEDKV